MIRRSFFLATIVLACVGDAAASGCDTNGVYRYGVRADIVNSAGAGALYLRSTDTATEMVIFGSGDASTGELLMVVGTVERDSSTTLQYGTYSLAGSDGTFTVQASYYFPYEPNESVAARQGSQRSDFDTPIERKFDAMSVAGRLQITFEDEGVARLYTPYADVVAAIDLASAEGTTDLFQVYNLGLFFSQVRIPAFGSLGMTRYITQKGSFDGLIGGTYEVSVNSLLDPTATITYAGLEDFPGELVDGAIVTAVDINGDGPMHGVISFTITGGTELEPVVFEGSVDYAEIRINNGLANSGNYAMTVTSPTAATASLPYTFSTNVDLRNVLPVTP